MPDVLLYFDQSGLGGNLGPVDNWAGFVSWTDDLDRERFECVHNLVENGWEDDPAQLTLELKQALVSDPPPDQVTQDLVRELIDSVESRAEGDGALAVTTDTDLPETTTNSDTTDALLEERGEGEEETMPHKLSDNQRKEMRDALVANCSCHLPDEVPWKGMSAAQINNLNDDELAVYDRWRKSLTSVKEQGVTHPNDPSQTRHVWNSQSNQWETVQGAGPAQNQGGSALPPPPLPPPPAPKPQTAEEWLASAPPEVREVFNTSLQVHNQRRGELIEKLMEHLTGDVERQTAYDMYKDMSLNQLERWLAIQPQPQRQTQNQAPVVNFFGAAGAAPQLATTEEPLLTPKYDFSRSN